MKPEMICAADRIHMRRKQIKIQLTGPVHQDWRGYHISEEELCSRALTPIPDAESLFCASIEHGGDDHEPRRILVKIE